MNVLVTESAPGDAGELVRGLVARGHVVRSCTSTRGAPCVALEPGGVCPLDEFRFDVMIDVRRDGHPRLSVHEYGALCALRQDLALIVAGPPGADAPVPWALALVAAADAAAVEEVVGYDRRRDHGTLVTPPSRPDGGKLAS